MRNPKLILIVAATSILIIIILGYFAMLAYSGSNKARSKLMSDYFKALASGDYVAASNLCIPTFVDELGLSSLKPTAYELFEMQEKTANSSRFFLVSSDSGREKLAIYGEIKFKRQGLVNRIEAIKKLDEGRRLN